MAGYQIYISTFWSGPFEIPIPISNSEGQFENKTNARRKKGVFLTFERKLAKLDKERGFSSILKENECRERAGVFLTFKKKINAKLYIE